MLEHPGAAILLDPGLGKTSSTLAAIKILAERKKETTLVVAPLRVAQTVWPAEAAKWTDFRKLRVVVLHGASKRMALRKKADVYVINPEGLGWLVREMQATGKRFDNLVVDESTKFKHTDTMRFHHLEAILHTFGRRWILTGTFTSNNLASVFGQMMIVDNGKRLGKLKGEFEYLYFTRNDGQLVPRKKSLARISEKIADVSLRMQAEDYIDLPDLVEQEIRVDLPPHAREVYQAMEEGLSADLLSGDKSRALSAGVKSNKCRQIANGAIYTDDSTGKDRPWEEIHEAKIEALVDLVEEIGGEGAIIAYDYIHDLHRIRKALGKDIPAIGGGIKKSELLAIERAWNNKEIPILLGHPLAMSHGLNFQHGGCHLIWFGASSDWEAYDQFVRRIRRQGATHDVVFSHTILANNTVDEVRVSYRKARGNLQVKFYAFLKQHFQDMYGVRT